jgi:hypothetical protein
MGKIDKKNMADWWLLTIASVFVICSYPAASLGAFGRSIFDIVDQAIRMGRDAAPPTVGLGLEQPR